MSEGIVSLEGAVAKAAEITKKAKELGARKAKEARSASIVTMAQADPTTLSCTRADREAGSWIFRVNYATGLFEELGPNGRAYRGMSTTARISNTAIVWEYEYVDFADRKWTSAGYLDRLSATGWITTYSDSWSSGRIMVVCRKATPII